MTAGDVVGRLAAAGCLAAEAEAGELLVAASGDAGALERMIRRREAGEPLAWITGRLVFGGRTLLIDPGVYVPRLQTQELAERAAALLPAGGRAVDLCTGSGAVAAWVAAAVPSATVVGVDLDPAAAACARSNGVPAVVADVRRLPSGPHRFDVVTAVAPYVPTAELRFLPADVQRYEPSMALDGGEDGLDLVRAVIDVAAGLLRPGGWLLTEVGGTQDRLLGPILAGTGFAELTPWSDEAGDLRGIAALSRGTGASSRSRSPSAPRTVRRRWPE